MTKPEQIKKLIEEISALKQNQKLEESESERKCFEQRSKFHVKID